MSKELSPRKLLQEAHQPDSDPEVQATESSDSTSVASGMERSKFLNLSNVNEANAFAKMSFTASQTLADCLTMILKLFGELAEEHARSLKRKELVNVTTKRPVDN